MTKAEALDKIRRLLDLSSSSNVDEARNAALAACRLIREHEIGLSADPQIRRSADPPDGQADPRTNGSAGTLRWRALGAEELGFGIGCDLYYQGCPNLATWELSSDDRSVITGHLCDLHVPLEPGVRRGTPRAAENHRRRRNPTVVPPATPMDIARDAADAAGSAIGTASRAFGETLGSTVGRAAVKGAGNVIRNWIKR
jgi:hypothetical protein